MKFTLKNSQAMQIEVASDVNRQISRYYYVINTNQ